MRIALINPPQGSIEQPFLALASLQGHLKRNGYGDTKIWDVSQRIGARFLTGSYLRTVMAQLAEKIARFEQQDELDVAEALAYEAALVGRTAAEVAAPLVDEATAALRDPVRFYDPDTYRKAMQTVDQAFQALSGLHYPQSISRRSYCGSLIADLDTDEDLRDYLADPARCLFHTEYLDGILDEIVQNDPDVVGLSATFQDQFLPALVLARLIKQRLPEAHVVMGGAFLPSRLEAFRRRPWLFDFLDSLVVGEGETALLELVRVLEQGRSLDEVPNLVRRVGTDVQPPSHRVIENLSQLGLPDYTGFDISQYLVPRWDVLYDPTRGCHWNQCTFCTVSLATKGAARQRDARQIVDDMEALCARYQTNVISFATDAIPVPLMREVCEEILRRKLDVGWSSEFTLDKQLDRETLDLFAKAGCLMLLFGFESANGRIVRAMKKGTVPERSARIIADSSEAGIGVLLHVMLGFPSETEAELGETLSFIEGLSQSVDFYEINSFHMDAEAAVYKSPEAFGVTTIGQMKREFTVSSVLPYQVASGISMERAATLLEGARERLNRAIGLQGRPYLHQDGAQLHLYLKARGRKYLRDLRERRTGSARRGPLLAPGVVPVQSPFDLAAISNVLADLRRRHRTLHYLTAADSATLWAELNTTRFERGEGFRGAILEGARHLIALDSISYDVVQILRTHPETFQDLTRLTPARRDLVEGLLNALERHGLVEWKGVRAAARIWPVRSGAGPDAVDAFVEIPVGGGVRHRYSPQGEGRVEPYPDAGSVPALAYTAFGRIPGSFCPANGSCVGAFILGAEGIAPGSLLPCKVLGIRFRSNGEHKVVVAMLDHPLGQFDEVADLPETILEALARWEELQARPDERWGSAEEGKAWIASALRH